VEGIWRFLTPQKNLEYWQFIHEYETIRTAEGRGSTDPAYYRQLPFRDLTGRYASDWKIRSQSYQALLSSVILPNEKKAGRPLKVLDLGAGNCWLSYRMAQRGHLAAAVDLQTNVRDALGARMYYDASFETLQADFQHLPFLEGQADLAIFNASFHYSTNYQVCLCEALRVLRSDGQVIILDSPIYQDARSGQQMVREREASYHQAYGFASNAIPSENFLTYARLEELGSQAGLRWKLAQAFYGLSWALRPLRAFLAGRREPAQFHIAVGVRNQR
jgi:SAM-dependent methyltransferase